MKAVQSKTLEAYQRVLAFILAYASILGNVPQLAAVATLTSLVNTLMGSDATQEATNAAKRGLTNQVKTLRTNLVGLMRPIAAIVADSVTSIPQIPALTAPPSKIRSGILVGLANGMVEAATPYQQTFIAAGLPATFLTDLSTAATNLSTAITSQGTTKSQRIQATQSLTSTFQASRAQMKIIDPSVITSLTGNTPMLTQWANVKRITPRATGNASVSATGPAPKAPSASVIPLPVGRQWAAGSSTSTPEAKAA